MVNALYITQTNFPKHIFTHMWLNIHFMEDFVEMFY